MVCIKGNGPLKRKMRTKEFIKSFFESWENLYLSLDGETLYFYISRNSLEPLYSIPLNQIKRVHVDLASDQSNIHNKNAVRQENKKDSSKANIFEDRFNVVLTTSSKDIILLR